MYVTSPFLSTSFNVKRKGVKQTEVLRKEAGVGAKTADGLREAVAHADKRLSEESLNASQQSSVLRRELQEKEEQLAQSRETHRREEEAYTSELKQTEAASASAVTSF